MTIAGQTFSSTNELTQVDTTRFRAWWFRSLVAVCVFMLVMTFITSSNFFLDAIPFDIELLWKFNLRIESNFAALWSGLLLLLPALHAFDGWAEHRSSEPALARAWMAIGLVLAALSFDEIASMHERLPAEIDSSWTYVPFGALFGGMFLYGIWHMYQFDQYRRTASYIGLAFLLYGFVAAQEVVQHRVDWPEYLIAPRAVLEEGTELLATLVLIRVTMRNTNGLLSDGLVRAAPVFEVLTVWRTRILVAGVVGAPLVALYQVLSTVDEQGLGIPSDWPTAAILSMAALAAIRPFLVAGNRGSWHRWALALACLFGCAATVLGTSSPDMLPMMALATVVSAGVWVLHPAVTPQRYVPAVTVCAVLLVSAWIFDEREFVVAVAVSYIALCIYYVNSSTPIAGAAAVPSSGDPRLPHTAQST